MAVCVQASGEVGGNTHGDNAQASGSIGGNIQDGNGVVVNVQAGGRVVGDIQEPTPADLIGVDQGELSKEDNHRMVALMENKSYPIFRRKTRWERGVILRRHVVGQSVKSTPQKRKNPSPENDCVEDNLTSKQSRRNTIGSPNNTSRKPPRKRTKSLSVIQGQSLITDMMKGTREQV